MPNTMEIEPGTLSADRSAIEETDEQLMIAFAHDKPDAFKELFSRYKQPLFGFFRRRVSDHAQAEELTQETFLAVLRASSGYQSSALFRTYLYSIAFRILQAHRRKTAFCATFLGPSDGNREPSVQSSIVAGVVVREAVGKLTLWDREILMLREYEQLSYAEIAELLKLPVNTVRSRLFRARFALREILAAPAPASSTDRLTEFKEGI